MEIINPNSGSQINVYSCGTDIFAPNQTCYDGGGCVANCPAHNPNNPCYACKLAG